MVAFLLILALIVAIIAIMFAIQNTAPVTVTFFLWQFHQSLALVLIIAVLVGALILLLAVLPSVFRGQWNSKNLKKRIVTLEKSLADEKSNREALEQEIRLLKDVPAPAVPVIPPVTATTIQPAAPITPPVVVDEPTPQAEPYSEIPPRQNGL